VVVAHTETLAIRELFCDGCVMLCFRNRSVDRSSGPRVDIADLPA
jgi:hypothetical protein